MRLDQRVKSCWTCRVATQPGLDRQHVQQHLHQTTREPTRQHTEQGELRKSELLKAAQDLFATRGYAATRVADICQGAGVAKGLFYWYFPTKESLFAELVRTMRHDLRRAQAAAMIVNDDPINQIRLGTEASVRFIADHRTYFAILDVERSDPAIAAVLDEGGDVYAKDVIGLIQAAQRNGSIPPGDPAFFAVGVLGAVGSFSTALRNGRLDADVDDLATRIGCWVVQALTGGPAPAQPDPRAAASRT